MKIKTKTCVVGAFYERPNGEIIYTYGWNGINHTLQYYTDGGPGRSAPEKEVETWKPLDIRDFPNAKDPRLPYTFDLLWDIEYMSQLRRELKGHPEEKEIRETMKEYGVELK